VKLWYILSSIIFKTKHKTRHLPTNTIPPEYYLVYLPQVVAEEVGHPPVMVAEVVPRRGVVVVEELQGGVILLAVEPEVVHLKSQGLVFPRGHQCCFSRSNQQCNLQELCRHIS
jgi:hypothetical protein